MARRNLPLSGQKVRELVRRRDMSLREFARSLDIKWSKFSAWINEANQISPEDLDRIADALDVPANSLLRLTKDLEWKELMQEHVDYLAFLVAEGDDRLTELTAAIRGFAPYFLPKVYGSGAFDARAFAEGLVHAQAQIAEGKIPEGMSEAEAQAFALSSADSDDEDEEED